MLTRSLAILILAVIPTVASAEELPAPEPTPQETVQPTASPDATGQGSASSGLGPPTSAASQGDGTALQPAGNNPLQSGGSDSAGLSAPVSQDLQGAAPSGDLKVLLGNEADGSRRTLAAPASGNGTVLDTLALILAVGLITMVVVLRRRTEATPEA